MWIYQSHSSITVAIYMTTYNGTKHFIHRTTTIGGGYISGDVLCSIVCCHGNVLFDWHVEKALLILCPTTTVRPSFDCDHLCLSFHQICMAVIQVRVVWVIKAIYWFIYSVYTQNWHLWGWTYNVCMLLLITSLTVALPRLFWSHPEKGIHWWDDGQFLVTTYLAEAVPYVAIYTFSLTQRSYHRWHWDP